MEPVTWEYERDVFDDVLEYAVDYHQIGWTVCGAEDPAVITISEKFAEIHPALTGFTTVRVIDKYVNANKSDTLLEFSDRQITDGEYELYEELISEMEE